MELTKLIARRQLGTALALYLDDADPVSVHTLACAGGEVAEHLSKIAGEVSFTSHALATFPEMAMQDVRRLQNQFWNAFKHARTRDGLERADEELLGRFNDQVNDHALLIGWYDYQMATKILPVEAQVFQTWYFARYPDKLAPELDRSDYERAFPELWRLTRADQKIAMKGLIARSRADPQVMDHPATDRRPLILSS